MLCLPLVGERVSTGEAAVEQTGALSKVGILKLYSIVTQFGPIGLQYSMILGEEPVQ